MVHGLPQRGVIFSAALVLAALSFALPASAQAVLQAGPILNGGGHAPMYLYSSPQGLATVMDSGAAGGGPIGYGLSEKLLQARGAPGTGTGPFGAHDCDWSTYATNAAGANYLCFDPNIGDSTAAIVAGAVGAAHPSALELIINGSVFPLPGSANGMPFVASESILANTPTSFSAAVTRIGFVAGDGTPPLIYDAQVGSCATNSLANDGGQCVNSSDGNSWRARFPAGDIDIREWGANAGSDVVPFMHTAWAANTGQCIKVPHGIWPIQSATTFTIGGAATGVNLPAPCFNGDYPGYHGGNGGAAGQPNTLSMTGTWMHLASAYTGILPFTVIGQVPNPNTGGDIFYGTTSGFRNMGFYEDQPTPGAGWAPNAYQYLITLSNFYDFNLDQLFFLNDTKWINATLMARLKIGTIFGEPLGTAAIQVDQDFDKPNIHDINLWPYWSDQTNVVQYLYNNVDPIVLGRIDGVQWDQYFEIGYHSCFKATDFGNGPPKMTISQAYCDNSFYGPWVSNTGDNDTTEISIGDLFFNGTNPLGSWTAGNNGIELDATATRLNIGTYHVLSVGDSAYHDAGANLASSGQYSANYTNIANFEVGNGLSPVEEWNKTGGGHPLFQLDNQPNYPGTLRIANEPTLWLNVTARAAVTEGQLFLRDPGANNGGLYEIEGLPLPWTPTLVFAGQTAAPTYASTPFGTVYHTASGGMTATFSISLASTGTASGSATPMITGLPVTCAINDAKAANPLQTNSGMSLPFASPVIPSLNPSAGNQIVLEQNSTTGLQSINFSEFTSSSVLAGSVSCPVVQ